MVVAADSEAVAVAVTEAAEEDSEAAEAVAIVVVAEVAEVVVAEVGSEDQSAEASALVLRLSLSHILASLASTFNAAKTMCF